MSVRIDPLETTPIGVGRRLGEYELVARLGRGGMATLFLARRAGAAGFARHVAVKVVHPHLASNERFAHMFIEEAKLSARIQHPNIVHVEELNEDQGVHYLVMEYLHSCSLAELLQELSVRRLQMSIELVTHIGIQLADGLHAAHETSDETGHLLGIVHRDISPQNILLGYRGHVKLIDFGIARTQASAQHTNSLSLKGKIRYMAPEQASARELDRRTDVYALGIVLWEALAMRRRFLFKDDFAALDAVRNPSIEPIRKYASDIPPALDEAVCAALAHDPGNRPPTAQAFRRLLAEACPAALAIESSDLAELLMAVMRDRIEALHQKLPPSISEVLQLELALKRSGAPEATPSGDRKTLEIVRTMTTTLPPERTAEETQFDLPIEEDLEADADDFADVSTQRKRFAGEKAEEKTVVTGSGDTFDAQESQSRRLGPRRRRWEWGVGLGAIVLVAGGGAFVALAPDPDASTSGGSPQGESIDDPDNGQTIDTPVEDTPVEDASVEETLAVEESQIVEDSQPVEAADASVAPSAHDRARAEELRRQRQKRRDERRRMMNAEMQTMAPDLPFVHDIDL